jgi:serine/threonine protein phosphatase 1
MIYAIGDIHGLKGHLVDLLGKIDLDAQHLGITRPRVVVMGDMIDRGSESRGVIELLSSKEFAEKYDATVLLGNHEDWLLSLLGGQQGMLLGWLRNGGVETTESYGVDTSRNGPDKIFDDFVKAFPKEHIAFLQSLPVSLQIDGYFFCHAGINPNRPLDKQIRDDLLWGTDDFYDNDTPLGARVVFGHVIQTNGRLLVTPNKVGVDTGGFRSDGCLSAAALSPDGEVRQLRSS